MSRSIRLTQLFVAIWLLGGGLPTAAEATLREFAISGAVTEVDDSTNQFGGLIEIGSPYRSTFRYHDVELRDSTSVPNRSHYHYDPVSIAFGLTIEIGPYAFQTDQTRLGELTIDDGNLAHDFFWMSISGVLSDEFAIHRIDLRLEDPTQAAFSNDIPPMSLDLSDFSERSVVFTGADLQSFIHLDIQTLEPIPEPGTGLSLMVGLCLLACHERRRDRCRTGLFSSDSDSDSDPDPDPGHGPD